MLNKLNYIYIHVCVSCPMANIAIGKTNMAVLSPFTFYITSTFKTITPFTVAHVLQPVIELFLYQEIITVCITNQIKIRFLLRSEILTVMIRISERKRDMIFIRLWV